MVHAYQGKERSFARAQGLVSAILTMAVLVSIGAERKSMTGFLAVLLSINHISHFWYFAIKTDLGSPRQLYAILTGPHRPMFWPAPLLIAYSAASVGYPALFWLTYKAVMIGGGGSGDEVFGNLEKVTLIIFWSIFIYFYTDRLVSDVFFLKFELRTGRALYAAGLLVAMSTSMHYSGLIQSLVSE